MTINSILTKEKMSKSQLSKISKIPYATINDICNGKSNLSKCTAETIYRLSKALNVSMEKLVAPYCEERPAFERFKSNVCHHLKALGDIAFLLEALSKDDVTRYYEREWYPESFYMLAMIDYLSRINQVPLCDKYDEMRTKKLQSPVFPDSIVATGIASKDVSIKEKAMQEAIPEFLRFNIIENEVRDVC